MGLRLQIGWLGKPFSTRAGSIAIQIAILSTVLLGFASLATEVTTNYMISRQMQSASDSAALAAVTAKMNGYPASYTNEALAMTSVKGFTNGSASTTVTINVPPKSGNYTSNNNAVEVVISQPQTLILGNLFGFAQMTVGTRSVAIPGTVSPCVVSLDASGSQAFQLGNGSTANLNSCSLGVNSSSSSALYLTGGSHLTAQTISVVGNESINGGSSVTASGGVTTGAGAMANPFANNTVPSYSGCAHNNYSVGGSGLTANPGVYCNGFALTNGSLTMNPGLYIIDRGSFNIGGGATLTGNGVTIVLTSSTGANYATLLLANGTTINLTAMSTGSTAGLIFFDDPRAPSATVNLAGGTGVTLNGALYFKNQTLSISNGASLTSTCLQLVAKDFNFQGGSQTFSLACSGQGFALNTTVAKLVE